MVYCFWPDKHILLVRQDLQNNIITLLFSQKPRSDADYVTPAKCALKLGSATIALVNHHIPDTRRCFRTFYLINAVFALYVKLELYNHTKYVEPHCEQEKLLDTFHERNYHGT